MATINFRDEIIVQAAHVLLHSLGPVWFAAMSLLRHRGELSEECLNFHFLNGLGLIGARDRMHAGNELRELVHSRTLLLFL